MDVTKEFEALSLDKPSSTAGKPTHLLDVDEQQWLAEMARASAEKRLVCRVALSGESTMDTGYPRWTTSVDEAWEAGMKKFYGAFYGLNGAWNPIQKFKRCETVSRWKILLKPEAELGEERPAFNHPDPCHENDCGICADVKTRVLVVWRWDSSDEEQEEESKGLGTRTENAPRVPLSRKYSKFGYKTVVKTGWRPGQGLGKENQGRPAPIEAANHRGRAGLGWTPKGDTTEHHFQRNDDDGSWIIFVRESSRPPFPPTMLDSIELPSHFYPITDRFFRLQNYVDKWGFHPLIFNVLDTRKTSETEKSVRIHIPETRAEAEEREERELLTARLRKESAAKGKAQAKAILAGQTLSSHTLLSKAKRQLKRQNLQWKKDE